MEKTTRRDFLKTSAAVGAGSIVGNVSTAGAARRPFRRQNPASVELAEVGVITCGYYSHIEDIWGLLINPIKEWMRMSGMVMTMVWDVDRKAAENFAQKYNVKVVNNYYDMVDKVDGIILSDYYATGWWPQLSKPYLEAGMPALINRPFALSMKEARDMIERSKKFNAPILVPSSHETMRETQVTRFKMSRMGKVLGAMALDPCGEYPAHGVHGIYLLHQLLQTPALAASFNSDNWWEFKNGIMNIKFQGKDGAPDFYTGLLFNSERHTNGWVVVSCENGHIYTPYDHDGDFTPEPYDRYKNMFLSTMLSFQKIIETGKMFQTYDHILNKTQTFLAGFYSFLEKKGKMVEYSEIPESWRAPEKMPDRFPKGYFD